MINYRATVELIAPLAHRVVTVRQSTRRRACTEWKPTTSSLHSSFRCKQVRSCCCWAHCSSTHESPKLCPFKCSRFRVPFTTSKAYSNIREKNQCNHLLRSKSVVSRCPKPSTVLSRWVENAYLVCLWSHHQRWLK